MDKQQGEETIVLHPLAAAYTLHTPVHHSRALCTARQQARPTWKLDLRPYSVASLRSTAMPALLLPASLPTSGTAAMSPSWSISSAIC